MITLGIDNTVGAGSLTKIGNKYLDNLPKKEYEIINTYINKISKDIELKDDWLTNLLCQYDGRYKLNKGDLSWYAHVSQMIQEGSLYMALFEIPNYAFPDKENELNYNNIKGIEDIEIIDKIGSNSDGIFKLKNEVRLYKVYESDEKTPKEPEDFDYIDIKPDNAMGTIEFGTQKICKTAMSLMSNSLLLRVPYEFELPPTAALFFNTKTYVT